MKLLEETEVGSFRYRIAPFFALTIIVFFVYGLSALSNYLHRNHGPIPGVAAKGEQRDGENR